MRASMLVARV